jgi:hypothetical protein
MKVWERVCGLVLSFFRQDMVGPDLGRDLQLAKEVAIRVGTEEPDDGPPTSAYAVIYLDQLPLLQVQRSFTGAGLTPLMAGPDEWRIEVPLQANYRRHLAQVYAIVEVLRMRGWDAHAVEVPPEPHTPQDSYTPQKPGPGLNQRKTRTFGQRRRRQHP